LIHAPHSRGDALTPAKPKVRERKIREDNALSHRQQVLCDRNAGKNIEPPPQPARRILVDFSRRLKKGTIAIAQSQISTDSPHSAITICIPVFGVEEPRLVPCLRFLREEDNARINISRPPHSLKLRWLVRY
jgi:hypothetical protein